MSAASRKFFALHLVADAMLLWLGYLWLGVGESTRALLILSALSALGILALACWFHGATMVFFRKGDGPAARRRCGWTTFDGATASQRKYSAISFCYWELLPAFAALLTKGWLRVDAFAFRTSVGLSLFIWQKRNDSTLCTLSARFLSVIQVCNCEQT